MFCGHLDFFHSLHFGAFYLRVLENETTDVVNVSGL